MAQEVAVWRLTCRPGGLKAPLALHAKARVSCLRLCVCAREHFESPRALQRSLAGGTGVWDANRSELSLAGGADTTNGLLSGHAPHEKWLLP